MWLRGEGEREGEGLDGGRTGGSLAGCFGVVGVPGVLHLSPVANTDTNDLPRFDLPLLTQPPL